MTTAVRKSTSKNVAKSSGTTKVTKLSKGQQVNEQLRRDLIAQRAYFKAEKRGFAPGFEIQDWLEAEQEVG